MRPVVKQNWKPILLLIVLSPFLAEIISGATPLPQFFLPGIFFGYVLGLYGLQVLVIREVAIRWKLGLLGLWCLGLVYGLYNEGLRTETLFYPLPAPLEEFFAYGVVGGVRVPFTVWISAWHGLFSVVTPILLVEYLFPDKARQPWLPLKAIWSVAVLSIATAVAYFVFLGDEASTQPTATLAAHLGFMVVAALLLSVAAGKLPRTPRITANRQGKSFTWRRLWSGALLYAVMVVVPEILAQSKIPRAAVRALSRRGRDGGCVGGGSPSGSNPRAGGRIRPWRQYRSSRTFRGGWGAPRQSHVGGIERPVHRRVHHRPGAHQAKRAAVLDGRDGHPRRSLRVSVQPDAEETRQWGTEPRPFQR
jgi:hypothetical protein